MPPTRRSRTSGGPALKGSQKTLSFGSSKATTTPKDLKSTPPPPPASKPIDIDIDIAIGHITSEAAVASQAEIEITRERTAEELRALKVTDAQIKRYWKERESERKTPRVHQEGLRVEEKILRFWDMSFQYGPAIGITRMKRWVRASKLGLAPPIEVLAVLLKEEEKGNSKIERAYVDELMSSKFIAGEAS